MTARMKNPTPRAAARRDLTPKPEKAKRGSGQPMQARARGMDTGSYANAELIDPNKPLTQKQIAFVKFWAQGESILSASTRAGYADGGTFAYRMVRMPNVLRLYEAEKAMYEAAGDMSRKKVMDMLQEGYDMAKLMAEPHAMISAAREMGKMCGYYEPVARKVEISVTGNIKLDQLNKLSDAELLKIMQQGDDQVQQTIKELADEVAMAEDEEEDD